MNLPRVAVILLVNLISLGFAVGIIQYRPLVKEAEAQATQAYSAKWEIVKCRRVSLPHYYGATPGNLDPTFINIGPAEYKVTYTFGGTTLVEKWLAGNWQNIPTSRSRNPGDGSDNYDTSASCGVSEFSTAYGATGNYGYSAYYPVNLSNWGRTIWISEPGSSRPSIWCVSSPALATATCP